MHALGQRPHRAEGASGEGRCDRSVFCGVRPLAMTTGCSCRSSFFKKRTTCFCRWIVLPQDCEAAAGEADAAKGRSAHRMRQESDQHLLLLLRFVFSAVACRRRRGEQACGERDSARDGLRLGNRAAQASGVKSILIKNGFSIVDSGRIAIDQNSSYILMNDSFRLVTLVTARVRGTTGSTCR